MEQGWRSWEDNYNNGLDAILVIKYSSNSLSISGNCQNVNCGFLFEQSYLYYAACHINDVSRGSVLGPNTIKLFALVYRKKAG